MNDEITSLAYYTGLLMGSIHRIKPKESNETWKRLKKQGMTQKEWQKIQEDLKKLAACFYREHMDEEGKTQ